MVAYIIGLRTASNAVPFGNIARLSANDVSGYVDSTRLPAFNHRLSHVEGFAGRAMLP
jgi:hypothetical protein